MNDNSKSNTLKFLAKKSLLAAGLAVAFSSAVYAIPSDRQQPLSLIADRATFNEKTGVTTYSGNVIIEQGTMKLQANSIVANLDASRQISLITANGGPARFQQKLDSAKGLAKGQAQKIVYNAQTGIITLTGNALLEQNGSSIRGATLRYSMNKGDIEAIGTPNASGSANGRVQIVIPPTGSKTFPGARD